MTTAAIPDFSTEEIQAINSTLFERFKKKIETQMADSELRLNPDLPTMTMCKTRWIISLPNFSLIRYLA
jgi:hypothetical protein